VLVLLIGGVYEVHGLDGLRLHDIHSNFHDDRLRHSSDIRLLIPQLERLECWYY
jgi:hypothetical protein